MKHKVIMSLVVISLALTAAATIWGAVIHFQHWEEVLSAKQKFFLNLNSIYLFASGFVLALIAKIISKRWKK